jgi:hypothetical protein
MDPGKSIFVDFNNEDTNLPVDFHKLSFVNAIRSFADHYEAAFPVPADCKRSLSVFIRDNQIGVFLQSKEEIAEHRRLNKPVKFFRSFAIPPDVDERMIAGIVRGNVLIIRMYKNVLIINNQIESDRKNIFDRIIDLGNYLIAGFKP